MNVRRQKRLISLTAAVIAVAAIATLVVGLSAPVDIEAAPTTRLSVDDANPDTASDPNTETNKLTLTDLRRVSSLDLRRPLFEDPTPAVTQTQAQPTVPLNLTLVGTVQEDGHSMAMLRKADGSITVCAEGATLDNPAGTITIKQVETDRVTLIHRGLPRVLEITVTP